MSKNRLFVRKVFLMFVFFLSCNLIFSQESLIKEPTLDTIQSNSKFTAAIDVVYPYLWRGLKYYGNRVAFQPSMNYAITDKFSVGVWATTNFSDGADAYNEFDWTVSYKINSIADISLSDYYWPATKNNHSLERSSYFDYSENSSQTLDVAILFDFSEKGIPIDFEWSTLIGGNDFKLDSNGNRTRAFSSYAEVGYTYSLEKTGVDFRPFVGAAVINGGYYGVDSSGTAGFTFSNVGLNIAQEFKISKNYKLPVFIRFTNNDYGFQNYNEVADKTNKTVRNFFSYGVTFKIK